MSLKNLLKTKTTLFFDLFFTLVSTFDNQESIYYECDYLNIDRDLWNRTSISQYHDRGIGLVDDPFEITKNIAHAIDPNIATEAILKATELRIKRFGITLTNVDPRNVDILKELKAKGYKLVLISNADVIDIMSWEDSPFACLFDEAIFSCVAGVAKPDKSIYQLAMDSHQVTPSQCAFIGDGGSNELEGATNLGITTILTTQYRGVLWPDTVGDTKVFADYTITHLNQLL